MALVFVRPFHYHLYRWLTIRLDKETWEPTIEHLFENDKTNKGPAQILEVWAIDCQNHGEAAPLNDEILLNKPDILTIHDYADAFVRLYRSSLLGELTKGVQKVVIGGHSAGTIGVVFATTLFSSADAAPFDMMILVDPPLYLPAMANNMTDIYRLVVTDSRWMHVVPNKAQFTEQKGARIATAKGTAGHTKLM